MTMSAEELMVHAGAYRLVIDRESTGEVLSMTYAEANQLQADIRKVLIDQAITMRDAF